MQVSKPDDDANVYLRWEAANEQNETGPCQSWKVLAIARTAILPFEPPVRAAPRNEQWGLYDMFSTHRPTVPMRPNPISSAAYMSWTVSLPFPLLNIDKCESSSSSFKRSIPSSNVLICTSLRAFAHIVAAKNSQELEEG